MILFLLVLVFQILPRRGIQIVSIDREHGWRIGAAPPQMKVVWEPAEPVETSVGDVTARDSLIRPQLAKAGSVLYFTLRSVDQGADIYRSRLKDGQWQAAEPVAELNTPSDDIGPVFQPGEKQLYLYSNRAGGFGGFDLFTSEVMDDGTWGDPVNLGAHINSPAHEYDPAATGDGRRLFFSSNRTARMSRQMAQKDVGEPGDRWDSTLRADLGLPTFDIYVARRDWPTDPWSPAGPMAGVNQPETNEGSPCISPNGMFVYFASDRGKRSGEARNFDLYRSRLDGDYARKPQNLGPGVNTVANEIEPALSDKGFQIVFSRDEYVPSAESDGHRYRLFSSVATEVEEEVFWDSANFAALKKLIKHLWWWVLLALLVAALIAAIFWYFRQVSLKRLPLPTFLLIALLIHVMAGATSFFVYFGEDIVKKFKRDMKQVAIITHLSTADMHQSHKRGPEAYEKVADLENVETVKPTEVVRQVTETPNVPVTPDVPTPNLPAKLTRELEPVPPDATLPEAETVFSGDPQLARRRMTAEELMQEKVEVEETEAEQTEAEVKPRETQVAMAPRRPLPDMTDAPRMERRRLDPQMELAEERVEKEESDDTPVETQLDPLTVELERAAQAAARPDAAETVNTEEVTAPAEDAAQANEPKRMTPQVDRQAPSPQTDAPILPRHTPSADAAMALARADASVEQITEQPIETKTDQQPNDLNRTAHAAAEPAAQTRVNTEEMTAPAESTAADTQPEGMAVEIQRQAAEAAPSNASPLLPRRMMRNAAMQLAQTDPTVDPVAEDASAASIPSTSDSTAENAIARTNAASQDQAVPAAEGQLQTETLAAASAAPNASPQGLAINVDRSEATSDSSAAAPQLPNAEATSGLSGIRLARADISAMSSSEAALSGGPADAGGEQIALNRVAGTADAQATSPEVNTEALGQPTAVEAGTAGPATVDVAVGRQAPVAPGTPVPATMGAGGQAGDTPLRLGESGAEADQRVAQASFDTPTGPAVNVPLAGQRGSAPATGETAGGETIATAALAAPQAEGGNAPSLPRAIGVSIGRQEAAADNSGVSGAPLQVAMADQPLGLALSGATDLSPQNPSAKVGGPATGDVQADLARAARSNGLANGAPSEQVATETPVGAAGSGTAQAAAPKGVGVTVERQAAGGGTVAPATGSLRVAMADRRVGLGGSDTAAERIAELLSGTGPKTGTVNANIARSGNGRAATATGTVPVETVSTEGPAVAASGDGQASSPKGVGVEVTPRGIVAPAPKGGALRVAAISKSMGLSGLGEATDSRAGTVNSPAPKTGSIAAKLSRARGSQDFAGIASVAVETAFADGTATSGDAKSDATGRQGVDVKIARRGTSSDGVATGSLQLAMAGSEIGSPRLSGQVDDLTPASVTAMPGSSRMTGQIARSNRGLARAELATASIPAEMVGAANQAGDGLDSGPPSVAGISVGLERATGPMLALNVPTSGKIGGLHQPGNHRLVIGSLESEANDAPPWFSRSTSLISRRPARAPTTLYAEDSIGMASMMKLRQVNEDEKEDLIEAFGGDEDTLQSLRGGLAWIVKQQQGDGRWSLNKFADNQSRGQGKSQSDTAGTALALLPLLGDGNTPTNGPYSGHVRKGIDWLISRQKADGDLYVGGSSNTHMYSHGMATIALCEAYGMTRDPQLREPAQKAVNFIVAAQHEKGGWRYTPGQEGDTSVFGWQIMALKSAQMAELHVPPETFDKAKKWLATSQKNKAEYGYQRGGGNTPAMTAEGMLCYQYLGASRSDPRLHEGAKYLLKHLPQKGKDTSYCWYYGNQTMYHLQGDYWKQWNDAMKDTLLGTQLKDGPMAGSWDPKDKWETSGGRIYSTSLRVLMLEVYYRHLPLYQVLER